VLKKKGGGGRVEEVLSYSVGVVGIIACGADCSGGRSQGGKGSERGTDEVSTLWGAGERIGQQSKTKTWGRKNSCVCFRVIWVSTRMWEGPWIVHGGRGWQGRRGEIGGKDVGGGGGSDELLVVKPK